MRAIIEFSGVRFNASGEFVVTFTVKVWNNGVVSEASATLELTPVQFANLFGTGDSDPVAVRSRLTTWIQSRIPGIAADRVIVTIPRILRLA